MRPKPDGPGQVHCGPTELWAATSPRQCSSGYDDPGDSGSLPGVGELFGTQDLDRGHSGCPVTLWGHGRRGVGDNAFPDCTATTGRPGRQSCRGEGTSGRWSTAAISHTGCGDAVRDIG